MKRPLCTVGFTFLLWLTVLTYIGNITFTLILALIAYCAFALSLLIKKSRRSLFVPAVCLSVCISSLLFFFSQSDFLKIRDLAGSEGQIVAAVKSEPEYNIAYHRYYCKAEIISIDGRKYNGNMRLSFSTEYEDISLDDFVIGNVIAFDGRLYEVGSGVKDIVDYFKSEKIYIGANSIENLTVTRQGTKPVSYLGNRLRNKISTSLKEHFSSDTAGLLTALVTGDKDSLSDSIYNDFRFIGIAHLMAVSGMHLTILAMGAGLILKRLKNKKTKNSLLSLFTAFIMFLANFSPSVVRAGTMHLMRLRADSTGRKADSLNSLGFALIIILTLNPFACKSVGLLLSVLSTLSIITVSLPLSEALSTRSGDVLKIKSNRLFSVHKAIIFSLITSVSVMVFTVPVLADSFGSFSLMSPIANLIFLPLSPILITVAAISALMCSVGFMPGFIADIIEGFTRLCVAVADYLSQFEGFMVYVENEAGVLVCFIACVAVVGVGCLARLVYVKRRYMKVKIKQ